MNKGLTCRLLGEGWDPRSRSSSAGSESQPEHESTGPGCCENVKCQYGDVYTEL